MSVFFLLSHEAGATKYSEAFDPATKFVTDWFGPPGGEVTIADMADPNAAPFESGSLLLTPMAAADPQLAEINTVHMLVHSAFVSPRPWVNEGLAHFAEALYREKTDDRQAAIVLLGLHQGPFVDEEKDVASTPPKSPVKPLATTFDEAYYRSKAAYVWWMLRDLVGDDALKKAIHNYRAADDNDPKYIQRSELVLRRLGISGPRLARLSRPGGASLEERERSSDRYRDSRKPWTGSSGGAIRGPLRKWPGYAATPASERQIHRDHAGRAALRNSVGSRRE